MGNQTPKVKGELSNVYIFNNIKNNEKDIELFRNTFGLLGCRVTEVKNQKFNQLKDIVSMIVSSDFSEFNYIVIIILDNENIEEHIWKTTDNRNFHINGHLMTAIYANPTLKNKLRFSIIQNNRVPTEDKPIFRNIQPQDAYPGKDVKFYATSVGCPLIHKWTSDTSSPFVQFLCEEISSNFTFQTKRPLKEILNRVSTRMDDEIGELPSKEMNFFEPIFLDKAKIQTDSFDVDMET